MRTTEETILRWVWTALGCVLAAIWPTLPLIGICTGMIFADCYTAWQLSRRVAKVYPDKVGPDGRKFKSHHFGRVINTLIKSYFLIIMAYFIEVYIYEGPWSRYAAGAICFWQLWSILENESSCNDAKWAKKAQRWLADKIRRHLDIDLVEMGE